MTAVVVPISTATGRRPRPATVPAGDGDCGCRRFAYGVKVWDPADYRVMASGQIRAGRERLGMTCDQFAAWLSGTVGWHVMPGVVTRWEQGSVPPGDVLLAANAAAAS